MTPSELVSAAGSLLDRGSSTYVRAAALLGRQALEQSLHSLWESRGLDMATVPMKAQLACLADYVGAAKAGEIADLWGRLSDACHHQVVDVGPAGAEVREWLAGVDNKMGVES